MRLEAIHAFRQPAMLESIVKLQSRGLYLHPGFPAFGRLRSFTDEAVNFFFDVDKRLFHGDATVNPATAQGKRLATSSAWFIRRDR